MTMIELIIIAVGLGMDACSVAICKGLGMGKINWKNSIIIGCYFATFQLIMPIIGYYCGSYLGDNVRTYGDIIAFALLVLLGLGMIKEAFINSSEDIDSDVSFRAMLIPSIATSIDALAVGVTISLLNINIITSSLTIFIITFILSVLGSYLGQIFGERYKKVAQLIGGIILITMGVKLLL